MTEKAVKLLERDYTRNYCILEMMKASENPDIDILNESVFIRPKDQGSFVMLSAPDRKDGEALLGRNLTRDDKAFYTIGSWPFLTGAKRARFHSECVQLYMPASVPAAEDEEGITALSEDMAPYIHGHYDHKDVVTEEYIRERIRKGPALGVMDHGVLAGWVMTHEEGTMGVLTVLPQYRRRGYASKLTSALIRRLRTLGKPCIAHIIKGNVPSLTMSKKLGMVYSCDVDWIFHG